MSLKAPIIIVWASLIATAAVASESQRLCELHAHAELTRLHEKLHLHEDDVDVIVVAEVDVTN